MPRFSQEALQQVLAMQQPVIHFSRQEQAISTYFPVRFLGGRESLRSHRLGAIVLDYDMSRPLAQIWSALVMESGLLWAAGVVVMLALIFLLNRYVSTPIAQLAAAMQRYSLDSEPVLPTFQGNGELAVLEQSFSRLTRQLSENHRQLLTQKNLYRTLSEMNQMLVRVENEQQLYQESCDIVVNHGGFVLAWIGVVDATDKQVKIRAKAGSAITYLGHVRVSADAYSPEGLGPTGSAINRNKAVIVNDFFARGETTPWQKEARQAGIEASAAFPISRFGQVLGALNIYAGQKDYFTAEIVELLQEQACRYLVIDFGTSKSPKSTRQRDNHYCPGRPASVPLRQHPRTLDAGFAALPQMTGRDFSYAYFVFPLRYRTPDKQCGPGRYRGLTAFASLSMAVSERLANQRAQWVKDYLDQAFDTQELPKEKISLLAHSWPGFAEMRRGRLFSDEKSPADSEQRYSELAGALNRRMEIHLLDVGGCQT